MDSSTKNTKSEVIFSDDVVVKSSNKSVIGYVSRVAGESDSEDDDDDELDGQVEDGHARVRWLNFPSETTEKLTSLLVVDRALLHGNIVAKANDPLGQTGMVISVDVKADLQHPSGKKMLGVDTKILRQPRDIIYGRYVVKGIWLGRVENVVDDVVLVFDDGSKCKCERVNPEFLFPVRETATDIDAECMFYPGQRVRASSSRFFRGAKWLKGSWQSSYHEATVLQVEAGSVSVVWICTGSNASVEEHGSNSAPPNEVEGKELIPIDRFCHTSWQVGDYTLPPPGWHDEVQKGEEGTEGCGGGGERSTCGVGEVDGGGGGGGGGKDVPASQHVSACINSGCSGSHGNGRCATSGETGGHGQRRRRKKSDGNVRKRQGRKDENWEYALQVVRTRSRVDVVWQDGTVDRDIDSCDLIHVPHVGDHDFWPEEYVVERSQEVGVEENDGGQKRKLGLVRSVNAKQRTAVVQWLEPLSADKSEGYKKTGDEEVVSVYELAADDDYTYLIGEVVIRLPQSVVKRGTVPLSGPGTMPEDSKENVLLCTPDNCQKETGRSDSVGQPSAEFRIGDDVPEKICESGSGVDRKDLWWVGEVTSLEDGQVEVAWANGTTSKVGPQSLYAISQDDDSDDDDDDGDSDGASWETVSDSGEGPERVDLPSMFLRNDSSGENLEVEQDKVTGQPGRLESHTPVNEETAGKPANGTARGALALPMAAIGLVSRIAAGFFPFRAPERRDEIAGLTGGHEKLSAGKGSLPMGNDRRKSTLRRDAMEKPIPHAGKVSMERVSEDKKSSLDTVESGRSDPRSTSSSKGNDSDCRNVPTTAVVSSEGLSTPMRESGSEMEGVFEGAVNDLVKESCPSSQEACGEFLEHVNGHGEGTVDLGFKRFECVKDCSDHHYFAESGQATSRKWAKAVQQEWSMLQKGLPDSIWVRVYEERMDLLRAAVAGAPGTPYEDNLFLFDLFLPPDFPNVPPVAYYHSWGFRLNPNLYESGKVCLSLLNTWSGRDTEIWHPGSSTLLQVLVSIQGLVLVPKPYFNEAGFDRQIGTGEGEKNSIDYNESAFLLSCKSMLMLIRRPPKHFEDLIFAHFRSRGPHILASCEGYIKGERVGSMGREEEREMDGETDEHSSNALGELARQGSSEGFKLMLGKIVPKLEEECKKLRLKKEVK